ncbi:MAG: dihydropteroate synthase [Paludibacteraceae bacterium]|nr:dihydropteroate synthase [Paludibacteraceae bacterium]
MNIRLSDHIVDVSVPKVMAIINITPDSFVPSCRCVTEVQALATAAKALQEGAAILDVGACSTRPGSEPVDAEQEWKRLAPALRALRDAFPKTPISVDTFRPAIAQRVLETYQVDMINDVSGGSEEMYDIVAKYRVPYILTFARTLAPEEDAVLAALDFFVHESDLLHRKGVADVILDPGFGFGKSIEQNYQLLHGLSRFQVLREPILVGISRKSMIYKVLNISPEEALNGTTVLHTLALQGGASILRVHDVKEAQQTIQLMKQLPITHNH